MSAVKDQLELLIKARATLIVCVTREEARVRAHIKSVCDARERPAYVWTVCDGMEPLTGKDTPLQSAGDVGEALKKIEKGPKKAVYFLPDLHDLLEDHSVKRRLRNLAQSLRYTPTTIIVSTHDQSLIPPELGELVEFVEVPLPSTEELSEALDELLKTEGIENSLEETEKQNLLDSARGLTYLQAQRAFAKSIVRDGKLSHLDIEFIVDEKKQIVRDSQALEFYTVEETPSNVGGLDGLKNWLHVRKDALSSRAKEFGLPNPKGVALIGIPGTGKSLSAKMIGNLWGLPLVRFDVGSVFGSFVGQSEQRTREALKLAESVSPCVLWIDEMEKAFAHGGNDSGTSTRVFGTILTWMSEKTAPCFVVATANDISKLPPELLRRGRFDEIFFLDLPNQTEREAIFRVHLKRRDRDPEEFDIKGLAEASAGYVGAEIEYIVIDGLYEAFAEESELTNEHLYEALKELVPLSVAQRERIGMLRNWLHEGRAKNASLPEEKDSL